MTHWFSGTSKLEGPGSNQFLFVQDTYVWGEGLIIKIWFPSCFLIGSIKMAEANCWVKRIVGFSRSQEGEEGTRRDLGIQTRLCRERK